MSEASDVFWLNVVNAGLGLVTLACVIAIVAAAVKELVLRRRESHAAQSDREVVHLPELGPVMADGGEPLNRTPSDADANAPPK